MLSPKRRVPRMDERRMPPPRLIAVTYTGEIHANACEELQFHLHIGRAQYKVLDTPVLIQDAPPDVTFLGCHVHRRNPRERLYSSGSKSNVATTDEHM